jgi:hypothetical protein
MECIRLAKGEKGTLTTADQRHFQSLDATHHQRRRPRDILQPAFYATFVAPR